MKLDMHMHTKGSDGRSTAEEIVERALAAGLDGICITDHHLVRTAESDEVADLAKRCGLRVFRGVEYSSAGGHILLYGVTDELVQTFGRYADPQAVIDAVNAAGGAAVVSHPFKGYKRKFAAKVADLRGLAAWEGVNGQCTYQDPKANRDAQTLGKATGKRMTGGSDAHDARDIGLAWTEFDEEFTTDRGLARALKRGGYRAITNHKRVERYAAWRTLQKDLWKYRGESVLDTMKARGQFGGRESDPRQANPGASGAGQESPAPAPRDADADQGRQDAYLLGVDFARAADWTVVGGPDDFGGSDF